MIENIYHHFHHVFLPNRKILRRFSSHPFQLRWHPVRLCNDHAELQTVHRYSRNSIRIRHQADRHSHGMALKLIHLKMHQLLPPLTPRIPVNLWIIDSTKALEKLSLILKIEKKNRTDWTIRNAPSPSELDEITENLFARLEMLLFNHSINHLFLRTQFPISTVIVLFYGNMCLLSGADIFRFYELVSIHIESR